KWTAVTPSSKERHFLITKLVFNEKDIVTHCLIEAVISNRAELINWRELKESKRWLQGWK
ncbi:MAG: TIGR02450 family Trp-rich protein, partial [Gammaproteobacteria bacterium]|nr:TIGR02450 family Trp-rich protein [Gammaproteobacteria bacterium]